MFNFPEKKKKTKVKTYQTPSHGLLNSYLVEKKTDISRNTNCKKCYDTLI